MGKSVYNRAKKRIRLVGGCIPLVFGNRHKDLPLATSVVKYDLDLDIALLPAHLKAATVQEAYPWNSCTGLHHSR